MGGAVGGVTSSYSNFKKGMAEKEDLEFAAGAHERNAMVTDYAAGTALEQGVAQQNTSRMKYGALRGEQKAALSGSGVAVGSGSALETQASTLALSDFDSATIRNNAAREAWGLRQKSAESRKQAAHAKKKAGEADLDTAIGSFGTLAGSIGA